MRGLQLYINSKFIIMPACVRLYIRTFDMVQIPFITNLYDTRTCTLVPY